MRWVVCLLVALGVAHAAPTVEIRAKTSVALARVKLVDSDTVEVVGALHDKLTGQGIPGERVTVMIGGSTQIGITADDGTFSVMVPARPGQVEVVITYAGDSRLEKAEPLKVTVDPTKAQVELDLVKTLDDPAGARLKITARSEGGTIVVPVALDITPVGGDSWKKLRTVETGSEFVFTRREAGGAGTYRLRAQFAGTATHQSATSIVTLELVSGSVTTMSLSSTQLAFEDELTVTGRVTDDDKSPLRNAAVTLMSGDRRLAQSTTNESGAYRFEIEAEVIGQGQLGVQVQADPGVSYIKGSRSNPQILRIAAPQPVPVSYTIAAFILTLGAAVGFFAARTKPWQKLRRAQRPAEVQSEEGEISEQVAGGLVAAKPGVVATLRRPNDEGFAGVVRETVRGRPLDNAVVTLVLGDSERSIRTGADGSFAIEGLATGEWRAEVAASGHVSERFTITVPHRGELRGVRVDLVPVRERVFQLYRRAAEPVLPDAKLWGIWSPRQIVDHVRAKRPSPALTELTDFVEEVYFSPRLSEQEVLPDAEGRVTRALNERARTPR